MKEKIKFSAARARKFQEIISKNIIIKKLDSVPKRVAGIDASYKKEIGIGSAVVYDLMSKKIVERVVVKDLIKIPYIPGFLAYRELPLVLKAFFSLKNKPELLLIDGHGRAHPRKAGLASHVGYLLKIPTIGVAKKLLVGEELKKGDKTYILYKNEIVGVVHEKDNKKLFVSIGNLITLEESYQIIDMLRVNRRLPIPLDEADTLTKRYVKNEI